MSEKWTQETGIVFALVFMVLGYLGDQNLIIISGVLLVAVLFAPTTLRPLAYIWLKLAQVLSFFVPKILFASVFFLIVVPMGIIRRLFGIDTLSLKPTTKKTSFVDRNILFTSKDLENPY